MTGSRWTPLGTTLGLALALCFGSPGLAQAQLASDGPPMMDGRAWKEAVDMLRYARAYRPQVNRNAVPLSSDRAFTILVEYTAEERLLRMLEDPSANLRVFAFWALAERHANDPDKVFNLAFDKLRDETEARSGGGCVVTVVKVGDAIMSSLDNQLTARQRERVLDYLLYQPNHLRLLETALRSWTIPARYRETLRSLVENGHGAALLALSRLKDEGDVGFIVEHAGDHQEVAFEVMAESPRAEYFAFLESRYERVAAEDWPSFGFYQALAAHGAERALPILRKPLERTASRARTMHLMRVFRAAVDAVEKDPGFVPLLWDLWEREQLVDNASFRKLWTADAKRAQKLTLATLDRDEYADIDGALLVRMLRLSAGTGRAGNPEMLDKVIARVGYMQTDEVVEYLGKYRPEGAIEPLFKRLEAEAGQYLSVSLARAILAFKRDDLNARLRALVKSNKAMTEGWAGELLTEILAEQARQENDG